MFLPIKDIAKMVRVPAKQAGENPQADPTLPNNRKALKKGPSIMLSPEHVAYLTSS